MYIRKKLNQCKQDDRRANPVGKAFMSFDILFGILPILMMIIYVMNTAQFLSSKSAEARLKQQNFDKLVSVADQLVKKSAVKNSGWSVGEEAVYPNWIDENALNGIDTKSFGKQLGLTFTVALDTRGNGAYCIYRIVVVGDKKEIRKLFVCGG